MSIKKIIIPIAILAIVGASGYYIYTLSKPAGQAEEPKAKAETPERLMTRAGWLYMDNRRQEANQIYRQIVNKHATKLYSRIAEARLREEGYGDYFSSLNESNSDIYVVKSGDSLAKIAKKFSITPGLVAATNGLKDSNIRPYQELAIMKESWRVLVDKSTNILVLKAGDRVVKTYSVGTGKGGGTPVGDFKIVNRLKNPTWYYEGTIAQPNAPDNPLGTRWMGFDLDGYGLHGTTDPESIGKWETLGCIRMLNEDVEEIFELLPVGTPISVIESFLDPGLSSTLS